MKISKKLLEEIRFEVEMKLYFDFNDKYCSMNEHMDDIYDGRDLDDLENYENSESIRLTKEAFKSRGLDYDQYLKEMEKKYDTKDKIYV